MRSRDGPRQSLASGEIVDEVTRGATGAAGAFERPAQRLGVQRLARGADPGSCGVAIHDGQIGGLVEAVEAEHQAEAVREGQLLVDHLAHVQIARVVEVRSELRRTERDLRGDIDRLEAGVVFINVWLAPLVVAGVGLFLFWRRQRRGSARR